MNSYKATECRNNKCNDNNNNIRSKNGWQIPIFRLFAEQSFRNFCETIVENTVLHLFTFIIYFTISSSTEKIFKELLKLFS